VDFVHATAANYLALIGLLILTSWSMVSLGLLVSTIARSVDQATSVIPLLLIPQLLFGGALVAVAKMSTVVSLFADLIVSRWSFAGAGHTIDMNGRLAEASHAAALAGYGTDFFSLTPAATAAVLLGFIAVFLLAAAVLLGRRRPDA
jgi:ABC transport system ATP-binding/permease protein